MGERSVIEWTNSSWNPWRGCDKVSPGCSECYMFRDQRRYGRDPETVVRAANGTFYAPLHAGRWHRERARALAETGRHLVFTCSWSDWFHPAADGWRDDAWEVIRDTPQSTYQILTKRPENILARLPADWGDGWPNVWLGVTIENRRYVHRADLLREVPVAVRFVSAEPLLSPLICKEALRAQKEGTHRPATAGLGCLEDRPRREGLAGEGDPTCGYWSREGWELSPSPVHAPGQTIRSGGSQAGLDGDQRSGDTGGGRDQPLGWRQDEQRAGESSAHDASRERRARAPHPGTDPATPDCWCGADGGAGGRDGGVTESGRAQGRDRSSVRRDTEDGARAGSTDYVRAGGSRGCLDLHGIDWLIAGGESGGREGRALVQRVEGAWCPKAEALTWVRDLRDCCEASGVAFLHKQWGGPRPTSGGRELDGRTWDDLPGHPATECAGAR